MSEDIKQELIQGMAKDPEVSMRLANRLRQKNRPVPDIILKGLTQDRSMGATYARIVAQTYVQDEELIPKVLIDRISDSGKDSYYLAKYCVDHDYRIPSPVFDSVEKSQFIGALQNYIRRKSTEENEEGEQKPAIYHELLTNILKSPEQTLRYAEILLKNGRPIPANIEKGFERATANASEYGILLGQYDIQPSEKIIKIISSDTDASAHYANVLLEQSNKIAPIDVIKSLAKNAEYASNYGKNLLIKKKINPDILQILEKGIVKGKKRDASPWDKTKNLRDVYASGYAIAYVRVTGNLPSQPVMDLVDAKSLVLISNNLWANKKEVPQDIVDKISQHPACAYSFKVRYNALFNKKLPPIYKKIDAVANQYDKEHI